MPGSKRQRTGAHVMVEHGESEPLAASSFVIEAPSVAAGSARAAQIAGGPLSGALLPIALLPAPAPLPAKLGSTSAERAASVRAVAQAISSQGWCICHGGLQADVSDAAASEACTLYVEGRLARRSFVRHGQQMPLPSPDKSNRDDLCAHLSLEDLAPCWGLAAVDEVLGQFALELCDELGREDATAAPTSLGTGPNGERLSYAGRGNLMVACYPGAGAAHGVHIDNADGDGRPHDFGRVLTLIYYLNAGWTHDDGGALRLFPPPAAAAASAVPPEGHSAAVDLRPEADVLVVFRADRVMHEVRPCPSRHRYAASVWILAGPAS